MLTETLMRFELFPEGPFSLQESIRFAGGFTPGGQSGLGSHLHLADGRL